MSTDAPTASGNAAADTAGVEGNERLTAVNGTLLVVLLAVEGFTVLSVENMITLHVYVGLLLVGPIVLKSISTGYRFVRYYSRSCPYVRKGPPHPILRILGPIVMVSSLAVLGTGIALMYVGPYDEGPWLTIHKLTFIVWFAVMTVHVLGHIVHAGRTTWHELRDPRATPATRHRRWRTLAIVASLVVGVGLATALTPAAHDWIDRSGHGDKIAAAVRIEPAPISGGAVPRSGYRAASGSSVGSVLGSGLGARSGTGSGR